MAKGFDTVNNNILIQKLVKLGIRNVLLNWIKNYLSNKIQRTSANGFTSSFLDIAWGVPQGSTLGPLVFIIYVNDLSNVLKNCQHLLYADDTVLYMTGDTDPCTVLLQQDFQGFKMWCDRNQLTMYIKKTKYVTFGLKSQTRKLSKHNFKLNDMKIERVVTYEYIGVILDVNLNFNKHLENCLKLISHKAYLLSKIRNYIDVKYTAVTIYKLMVLPIIEYGDILYEG